MSKDKEEAAVRHREGCNHNKIGSHTHHVGDPQTGEQEYQRSSPTVLRVLNPKSGFPAGNPHGIWPGRPAGFDYRTSIGLGETEAPVLEGN